MEWWQAVVLGAVQGVTEFLPISSDGHLILVQNLIGLPRVPITFDILVHAGTLVAMFVFFWRQLWSLHWRQWVIIGFSTIPAVIFGLLIRPFIEAIGNSNWAVAFGFWVTASFLLIADTAIERESWRQKLRHRWQCIATGDTVWPTLPQGMVVGLAQALAILPGVSRSGSTLMAGTVVGLSRHAAFEFAFLVGVPAIAGAVLLDVVDVFQAGNLSQYPWPQYIGATFVSAVSGIFALKLLEYVMVRSRLKWFALYCIFVGILSVLFV